MTATMVFLPGRGQEPSGLDRVLSRGAPRNTLTGTARHARVDQAIPPEGPVVLVSHSLGTVVACDLRCATSPIGREK